MKIPFLFRIVVSTAIFVATSTVHSLTQPKRPDPASKPVVSQLRDVAVTSDGKLAMAGDSNGNIHVWDIEKRGRVRAFCVGHPRLTMPRYCFSTDGNLALVSFAYDGPFEANMRVPLGMQPLVLWNVKTATKSRIFEIDEPVGALYMSPTGSRAISISVCKKAENLNSGAAGFQDDLLSARLWDLGNGKMIQVLRNKYPGSPFAFSHDSKRVATLQTMEKPPFPQNQRWALISWDANLGNDMLEKFMEARLKLMEATCLVFSPCGRQVLIGSGAGASLWDLAKGTLVWHYSTHLNRAGVRFDDWPVTSVAFSSDGKKVVAAGTGGGYLDGQAVNRGGMVVLDSNTGKASLDFVGTSECVHGLRFSPSGEFIFGARNEALVFWYTNSGKQAFVLDN